jgi:preprotein translocase subunit YajC
MGYLLMGAQPGAQGGAGGGFVSMFLFMGLIILVMYFFMIRPQQKRQKEHQRMLSDLKKGDRVVTTGGMYATVFGFSDDQNKVILKISDEVKMEFLKSAIAQKVT